MHVFFSIQVLAQRPEVETKPWTAFPLKLTKSGAGAYRVQCATSESFVMGTITVQGGTISGKIVDRADEFLVRTFSLTGDQAGK